MVSGADEIKVTFLDGREFEGKVIGSDTLTDIAVVKIGSSGSSYYFFGQLRCCPSGRMDNCHWQSLWTFSLLL